MIDKNEPDSISQPTALPLVALIGPVNAGKSTLFNRLTGSWQAVTAKEESTTRDRVFGEVNWQGHLFNLVDTGGLTDAEAADELYPKIHAQTLQALNEADLVLFVYDARTGLADRDKLFLDRYRGKKTVWLIANKIDSGGLANKIVRLDNLGLPYLEVSATTGRATGDLLEAIAEFLPSVNLPTTNQPLIAIVGRPNVGKSTLLNALTETERAVVSPVAGTTRDIVTEKLELNNQTFLLADTAGIRRRGRIVAGPELFSVKRALTAIAQASGVLVLIDVTAGTTRGDLHLIYYAKELKKPTLLVFNKIDLLKGSQFRYHNYLEKFDQVGVSALTKENIHQVAEWISQLPN